MKVDTINIKIFKIHTTENLRPATDDNGGERAVADTTTTTGDTTIIDTVTLRLFKAPSPYPLNNEASKVKVAHPMDEMPIRPLSPSTEAVG